MAAENTFDDKAATWDQNPGHQQSTSIAAEVGAGSPARPALGGGSAVAAVGRPTFEYRKPSCRPWPTPVCAQALKGSGLLHPGSTAVLDLGCGTGLLAEKIADSLGALVGVDTSPGMIAAFQRKAEARGDGKLRCVLAELTGPESLTSSTPADGGAAVPEQYDLAISLMTFHHIQDIAGGCPWIEECGGAGCELCVWRAACHPQARRRQPLCTCSCRHAAAAEAPLEAGGQRSDI